MSSKCDAATMQNSSITPRLIVASPDEAIAFYQKAFGAELEERFEQDGVVVHALLKIGRWTFSLSEEVVDWGWLCLLYTSPSPRDRTRSRMPSSA